MATRLTARTVAIFNGSDDTVGMLREILSIDGYVVVAGEVDHVKSGETDFLAYLETHTPAAIIWDIVPPLRSELELLQADPRTRSPQAVRAGGDDDAPRASQRACWRGNRRDRDHRKAVQPEGDR